jgi:NTE family protein
MNGTGVTLALESVSQEFALFRALSGEQRMKALNAMVRQDLVRGQMLVAQGGPSDSLTHFLTAIAAETRFRTSYRSRKALFASDRRLLAQTQGATC